MHIRNTWTAAAAALLLAVAPLASGETEVRDVKGFDRVMFALPGRLTLARGDAFEVEIDALPEDLERIETRVSGNELAIRWKEIPHGLFGGNPEGDIAVSVTLPALEGLELAGSGDAEAGSWVAETFELEVKGSGSAHFEELAAETLTLDVAGSGDSRIEHLDVGQLRVELKGSGDVELAGAADRQQIRVMGSGDVTAQDLEGATVDVRVMGSGDVRVWATDSLSAEVMGSGDIGYRGTPRVQSKSFGSGNIEPL